MTLVPEGKVWNYGIGLTQMWTQNIGYSMTLDTPLHFWAEPHRPAAFLTVSCFSLYMFALILLRAFYSSLQILKRATTAPMLKIVLRSRRLVYD